MRTISCEVGAVWLLAVSLSLAEMPAAVMSPEEIEDLKLEAKDMFYHAYNAYMEKAYPADELMPLSCKGRYRDPENSRGDLDDSLGNFSLTLIDTLDTLVVIGDVDEFERAVKLVIDYVTFDQDIIVSVFETNIRVLGGLLSAHVLAEYVQQRGGGTVMNWYRGELLHMAKDLGFRLLPAFNTTTGIPYSRVNLRRGMSSMKLSAHVETCTSCAGTMVLEMAALSRLTGEPVFEQKAHRAMDQLWTFRHRASDLMGNVLNVHSGDWVRRDSGVGAGIDSYYEYCLKAYILLGEERYLARFSRHYSAIMKYISQGPLLVDVHMHRPNTNSKNFMDALLAFWPGLQVLMGDIAPAVATHEMLYQVMLRHNLIPEAFTTDFQVHWGQHPLRPEFLESTYFLYKATNDPYYLQVGKAALKSLQKHARVPCGYATIKDVRTGGHDDRMDSFVLAETFKYLYLLFAKPSDLILDLDEFIFTTEAHLLPLTLARGYNHSRATSSLADDDIDEVELSRSCPNTLNLFPESVRLPLKNMVDGICPRRTARRRLYAAQFTAANPEHVELLKAMGISVLSLSDGRVHLLHSVSSARTAADAQEGVAFMQEMMHLSEGHQRSNHGNAQTDRPPVSVSFTHSDQHHSITAGRAHFGRDLTSAMKVTARVSIAEPLRACELLSNPERLAGRIVLVERGDCIFVAKVRRAEQAGALAVIVVDNTPGSSAVTSPMFAMSGDGTDDVTIPAVFLFYEDASQLLAAIVETPTVQVTIADHSHSHDHEGDALSKELTDSLMGRLRGSLEELLGPHTHDTSGPQGPQGPQPDNTRPQSETGPPGILLAVPPQDAPNHKLYETAPSWLDKVYDKLVLDGKVKMESDTVNAYSIVDYVMKVYLSVEGNTQRPDNHRVVLNELKTMLNKMSRLVDAMQNDSEFAGTERGKRFIHDKLQLVQLLNILTSRFQAHVLADDELVLPEQHNAVDDASPTASSITNAQHNYSQRSKDEL